MLDRGVYENINYELLESLENLEKEKSKILENYNITDYDTVDNLLKDSKVCSLLGFEKVNVNKHGFDGMSNDGKYLEVKQCSIHNKSWSSTYNDTTFEKADKFKNENVCVALSISKSLFDIGFIVYGYSTEIGYFLEEKVKNVKIGSRKSFSISFTKYLQLGFKIKPVGYSKDEVYDIVLNKYKNIDKTILKRAIYD